MSTNTLKIDLKEEFKIKIENPSQLDDSFFSKIYLRAAKTTADIIRQDPANTDSEDHFFQNQEQEYNNIIAFCGERGTGKSSAMITYARSLLSINCATLISNEKIVGEEKLSNYNFRGLEVIDPSLFEKGENIFEVILAQLFSSFEKELIKRDTKNDTNDKRKVLELFEKVYQNLQTVKKNGQKYDGEALETLSKLACGANLRNNFKELINLYLNFISDNNNKSVLILAIDDFDLNVEAVAEMAEQIRKYLMIPRVVILMAVNIELLNQAKKTDILNKMPLEYQNNNDTNEYRYIATRFTSKFIPEKNRLYLPLLKTSNKNHKLEIGGKTQIIEDYILNQIYLKTNIILVKNNNEPHLIVPETIRELKHFIHFFDRLRNVTPLHHKQNTKDPETLKNNLEEFNNYLIDYWASVNLSEEYQELLKELDQINFTQKNQFIISRIINKYHIDFGKTRKTKANNDIEALYKSELKEGDVEPVFIEVINKNNNFSNISLGDVMKFIKSLINIHNSTEDKRLFLAFKIKYSAYILEDIIIDKSSDKSIALINGFINHFETNLIQQETISQTQRLVKNVKQPDKYLSRQHFKINYSLLKNRKFGTQKLNKIHSKYIEIMHYFINHFGHEEYKRSYDSSYTTRFDEPISNIGKAYFDVLMPVISQFYTTEISKINNSKPGQVLDLKEWRKLGSVSILPIYSIDLLDQIIDPNYIFYKNISTELEYFQVVKGFYYKIEQRIELITSSSPAWKDYVANSLKKHPLIITLKEEDNELKQLFNELRIEEKNEIPQLLINNELEEFLMLSNGIKTKTIGGLRRFLSKAIRRILKYSKEQFSDELFIQLIRHLRSNRISVRRILLDTLVDLDSEEFIELNLEFRQRLLDDIRNEQFTRGMILSSTTIDDESTIDDLIEFLNEFDDYNKDTKSSNNNEFEVLEIEMCIRLLQKQALNLIKNNE